MAYSDSQGFSNLLQEAMMFFPLARSRHPGRSRTGSLPRRSTRLLVEELEPRLVLSQVTFTPPANAPPNIDVSNLAGPQAEVHVDLNPTNPGNLVAASNEVGETQNIHGYFTNDGGSSWH